MAAADPSQHPAVVPFEPDAPGIDANREAWGVLRRWEKPFLCAFSDSDPVSRGADRPFRAQVPGAQGQAHTTIADAGHFLQEDQGEAVAAVLLEFIASTGT
jgi:haloalkane dehalogenase